MEKPWEWERKLLREDETEKKRWMVENQWNQTRTRDYSSLSILFEVHVHGLQHHIDLVLLLCLGWDLRWCHILLDKLIMLKSAWLAPHWAALKWFMDPYVHFGHKISLITNKRFRGLDHGSKKWTYSQKILIDIIGSSSAHIHCVFPHDSSSYPVFLHLQRGCFHGDLSN